MTRSTRLTLILLIVGMFVLSAFADRASAGAAQEGKVVSDFSLLVGAGDFYTLPIYAMMRDYATRYNLRLRRADITGGGLGAQMFAGGTGDILVIGFQGAIRLAETQTVDV
ncbi:MAG: hypothetical protein HYY65_00930, partial [Candidatus Tectomicrobia bacterium]|nr:hypothetical protein [Candidatus Tectomicrobia bacterium]